MNDRIPSAPDARPLSRAAGDGRAAAPVRIAHLGLGNFFRAHQAWYTDRAPDADAWGIAAFTGRRADLADALRSQDGLYTLVTRGIEGDRFDVVSSVSAVHAAAEHEAWLGYLRSAALAIVTLTVTEAGYARGADGGLDVTRDDIQADVAVLREEPGSPVRTPLGRLVAGLLARRDAQVGPITVVPCDNLPENGAVASRVVGDLADLVDPTLRDWIDDRVSWITTMVDRITPRTTPADRETVRSATGVADAAPVVTEPFSEWVLSGDFVAGSPGWEEVGARLVADIAPFEERKLWLLNGGHSLLAYAGSMRGHETVAEAVTDPTCRGWLEQWWTEASRHLSLPEEEVSVYRAALLERFANPGIRHLLAQIAADGSQKLPVRILPTLRQQLDSGVVPTGGARVLAAWMCHLRGRGAPIADPAAAELVGLASGPLPDAVRQVLSFLDRRLGQDERVVDAVLGHVPELCP